MNRATILIGILFVALVVGLSSVFTVDERERALVLQFGQIKDVKEEPGLAFKIPFIQDVVSYDDRIQSLDTDPLEVTPLDDRRLVVDAFARWRISDVVQFRKAVGTGGIFQAENRLDLILRSNLREVLGTVSSNEILSADRVALMNRIRDAAIAEARSLGVEVIDVRIKRADLPATNLKATFERMVAERHREAADERARGQEAAQRVRAQADRTAVELTSDARREADVIRGEADAQRNAIFAEAYGRDPEFFAFYRSLNAYEKAIGPNNSTMVLTPDSEFFSYLRSDAPDTEDYVTLGKVGEELEANRKHRTGASEDGASGDAAAPDDGAAAGDAGSGDATGGDATGGDATGGDATGGDASTGDATKEMPAAPVEGGGSTGTDGATE